MTHDSSPDDDDRDDTRRETGRPEREDRSYPHGSGDRNAWTPSGDKGRMPRHDGGARRDAPPEPPGGVGDE